MAKRTTQFVCRECGHTEPKWLGQCPDCGEWNTFDERPSTSGGVRGTGGRVGSGRSGGSGRRTGQSAATTALSAIQTESDARIRTGIGEFDRVLGGGLVPGSCVLVGGEPGIGKSTLMLQVAGAAGGAPATVGTQGGAQVGGVRGGEDGARGDSEDRDGGVPGVGARRAFATQDGGERGGVLYVSGEEAARQIRRRADRLSVDPSSVSLLCSTDLETVVGELHRLQPRLVIVDSVQTLVSPDVGGVPGTINQIKYATHEFTDWARLSGGAVLMVAHVTKEGQIAGPKVIEHLVDTVMMFEHGESDLRILRAAKNRHGAIEEVGLFTMRAAGLLELSDPARAFLENPTRERPAGVIAAPCYEGSRVLLVELQALTVPAKGSVSRTFSDRIDGRRVSRVAAVLEKHVSVRFSDQDVYVNVAGGIRIQDVAVDLPLALALYSARTGLALPPGVLSTGELTLAGEIRPVLHADRRLRSARDLGFTTMVGPRSADGTNTDDKAWTVVRSISDAIGAVFGTGSRERRS